MKDLKLKVFKRVVSFGLAASFLPVAMNVGGLNQVYGASESEWSFGKKGLDQSKEKVEQAEYNLKKVLDEYNRVKDECKKAYNKREKVYKELNMVQHKYEKASLAEEEVIMLIKDPEKVRYIHDELKKVYVELEKIREKYHEACEELVKIVNKKEKIEREVNKAEDELRKVNIEYRDFENEIKEAKKAVKTEDESEILGYMIRKAENEYKKVEEEINGFQREFIRAEERVQEEKAKVEEANEKVSEFKRRINEIEKNINVNIDRSQVDRIALALKNVMEGQNETVEVRTADEYVFLVKKMNLEYGLVCEEYELAKESKVGLVKAMNKKRKMFSTLQIVLGADIDMNGRICPTIMCFRGILNGGGHKLTNIIFTRKEGICNFGCVPGMVNDIEVENVSYIQEVEELKLLEEDLARATEILQEMRDAKEKVRDKRWSEERALEKIRLIKEKIEYLESLRA